MDLAVQLVGVLLVLAALVDIFLTVLHAQGESGFLSPRLNRTVWRLFRLLAQVSRSRRDTALSHAGPLLLALTVALWVSLLLFGFALVYLPALGKGIVPTSDQDWTGFASAVYFSGTALTTVGFGDLVPREPPYRLIAVAQAALGFSVVTLSLTYFLSIYNALIQRNAFALELDLACGGRADATELVVSLTRGEDMQDARANLTSLGRSLLVLLEGHQSYPIIHYYRRREVAYATARIALLTLDAAALIRTVLDRRCYDALITSSAVRVFWGAGLTLVSQTGREILPDRLIREYGRNPNHASWRQRYLEACDRFAAAGLEVVEDREAGAQRYIELRGEWDRFAKAFADYMAYDWWRIDPLTKAV